MPTLANTRPVSEETGFLAAYDRVLPALKALPAEKVRRLIVNVPSAVALLLTAYARIAPMRAQLVQALPQFDATQLDKLQDYALALRDADVLYAAEPASPAELATVAEEAIDTRGRLSADVDALTLRGLLDATQLDKCTNSPAHKDVAKDLLILVAVLHINFATIQGHCGVTEPELDRAAKVAGRLLRLVGERDNGPITTQQSSDLRDRAFTICDNAYDEVRRALHWVRWEEDDADTIAPSLYAGRKRRPSAEDAIAAPATPATQAPAPSAQPFMQ